MMKLKNISGVRPAIAGETAMVCCAVVQSQFYKIYTVEFIFSNR
jgi:hypothetical protein